MFSLEIAIWGFLGIFDHHSGDFCFLGVGNAAISSLEERAADVLQKLIKSALGQVFSVLPSKCW